jgi:hypothetical protein
MHRVVRSLSVLAGLFMWATVGAYAQQSSSAPSLPDFDLQGIGFTSCQCPAYGCPCRSNGHPTHGTCEAADFAYIQKGYFGGVRLDGVRFVTVGNLVDSDSERMYGTLYIDESTSPAQRQAVYQMITSLYGPWTQQRVRLVAAPVRFYESADHTVYVVEIPGILTQLSVLKRDSTEQPISTVPAMDPWGNTIHYADNIVFRYNDGQNHRWDLSGRQSNLKFFHTTRQMYENGELLIQHGDMSGTWTEKQKEILKTMKTKEDH